MAVGDPLDLSDWAEILTMRRFYHACRNAAWKIGLFELLTHHYMPRHTLDTVRLSHLNWGPYFLIDKIVTEKFDKKYNILSFSIVFMLSAIVLEWNGQIWVFTNICLSKINNDLHFEKCYFLHLFCTSMQKPKIVFLVSQQINYTFYRQTSIWFEHWAQNTNLTLPLHSICFVMNLRIWKKNLGFSLCEAMHWLIVLENAWRFFFAFFN